MIRRQTICLVLLLLAGGAAACARDLSPEEVALVDSLKKERDGVEAEIKAAEARNAELAGGLVKSLVETRLELLKTNLELLRQRIHAIEAGGKIEVVASAVAPDPDVAEELAREIESQEAELAAARADEARYSGGLVKAMKASTVATQEMTLAMLRQRYLSAKYGLAAPVAAARDREEPAQSGGENAIAPKPEAEIAPNSGDLPAEIIQTTLRSKRFAEQNYQDFIFFDLEHRAIGLDKPARAVKGVLELQDLFGDTQFRMPWSIDEPLTPSGIVIERGMGFKYNQFMDEHNWVKQTDLSNMRAKFVVRSILYLDGSRLDF